MLSNSVHYSFPRWSFGPMAVFSLTFLYIAVLLFMYPSKRNSIVYAALTGAIAGFLYYTFLMVNYYRSSIGNIGAADSIPFIVYGIYIAFTFVPGLIGFRRISTANKNPIRIYFVHFGYLCAIVTAVIGLALTAYIPMKTIDLISFNGFEAEEDSKIQNRIVGLISYMNYSGWAFVATYLCLLGLCRGKTPFSLIAYSFLNIMAVLVNTILSNVFEEEGDIRTLTTFYVVSLIFCTIPVALALTSAAYYSNFWKQGFVAENEEINVNAGSSVRGEENSRLQV